MLKRRARVPASQLDAEIRPSMAHKVHQNFAKNIRGAVSLSLSLSLSFSLLPSLCTNVCACVWAYACTLNLIWPAATQEFWKRRSESAREKEWNKAILRLLDVTATIIQTLSLCNASHFTPFIHTHMHTLAHSSHAHMPWISFSFNACALVNIPHVSMLKSAQVFVAFKLLKP